MPPRSSNKDTKNEFEGDNEEGWWRSDSSESEAEAGPDRSKVACEEELYEANMDEKDARWADEARRGRVSDAVLSCPGCFTMLTTDCQQHDRHKNQFRVLRSPSGGYEKKSSKIKKATTTGEGSNSNLHTEAAAPPEETDSFHPVACASCGTEVGVQDSDEVYHFFHVVPSNA